MSHIVMKVRWHNLIFLNVHTPSVEESDDSKDSIYEELVEVFIIFITIT